MCGFEIDLVKRNIKIIQYGLTNHYVEQFNNVWKMCCVHQTYRALEFGGAFHERNC